VEQITVAVKQHDLGTPPADIARNAGHRGSQTFCPWKEQYGGLEAGEEREVKQLRAQSAKLKKLVADLSLEMVMLQDLASRKVVGASQRRSAARHLQQHYSVSERRGCDFTGSHRGTHRYTSTWASRDALRRRIRELARSRARSHRRPTSPGAWIF
jgi:putative transposase